MNNSIIMIPYAFEDNMQTGVNINTEKKSDIYLKNCCVSLLSAKKHNITSDIALVTNTDIPNKYKQLLTDNNILIIHTGFTSFKFSSDYKWGLAFYKLCALKYAVENYNYEFYSYMDSDVYIQSNFENIWAECSHNILLYDINHGLQVKDYRLFLRDVSNFSKISSKITQYGGEFFAASKENAKIFISECYNIYSKMITEHFHTNYGDEFIISLAAFYNKPLIKNAGAYIYRFWTGTFRLTSTCFSSNPVAIIHVPAEKKYGMLKIYKYFLKRNKLPPNRKAYKFLSLKHPSLKTIIKSKTQTILNHLIRDDKNV